MSSAAILGKTVDLDDKIVQVTAHIVKVKVTERSTFDKLTDSLSAAVSALTPGGSDGK